MVVESATGCAEAAAEDSALMRNGNRCVELRERDADRVLKRVKRLEMAAEDRSDDDVEHVMYGIDASFRV